MELKKKKFKDEEEPQNFLSGGQVGNAAKSALAGAGTGAAIGSVVPGIGTAIGAVGGGLIGGIGSLLSDSGSPVPQAAMPNIVDPVTGQQITDAYGNVVANQQALQNYNAQLAGQGGIQNQQDVYNQYKQLATGQSPLAKAMLAQATGENVANQAALMASQRGAGANPALIARQAARQGAGIQQTAAGQAATLQAQQQLAALQAQAGIAGQQVGQLQTGLGMAGNLGLGVQGQLLGAQGQYNTNVTGGQGSINTANAPINLQAAGMGNQIIGGVAQGAGALLSNPGLFKGQNPATPTPPPAAAPAGGTGYLGANTTFAPAPTFETMAQGGEVSESPKLARVAKENRFPSSVHMPPHIQQAASVYHPHHSFGHKYEQRSFGGGHFAQGGMAQRPPIFKEGGKIPGKAKHPGDTKKNDTVPAMLSPGEVVIPKSVMESRDPVKGAANFVAALEAKKNSRNSSESRDSGDFKEALQRAIQGRKKKKEVA